MKLLRKQRYFYEKYFIYRYRTDNYEELAIKIQNIIYNFYDELSEICYKRSDYYETNLNKEKIEKCLKQIK